MLALEAFAPQLIHQAVEIVSPLPAKHRHTLDLNLSAKRIMADVDMIRNKQVIGNLLHNAVKYACDGG